jgi:hypothetical protein
MSISWEEIGKDFIPMAVNDNTFIDKSRISKMEHPNVKINDAPDVHFNKAIIESFDTNNTDDNKKSTNKYFTKKNVIIVLIMLTIILLLMKV